MNKIYIISSVCVVLIAVLGYAYTAKQHLKEEKPTSTHIILYKEYGFITWKENEGAEYKRVTEDETSIPNNAYVKTVEGRGYVLLPDNSSIALDTNTEIRISYEEKGTSIMQFLGSTYHRVEALTLGKTYEVATPNTLASVRGTKLSVKYNPRTNESHIDVTEHIVLVTPTQSSSTPVSVEEGNSATVGEDTENGTTTGKLILTVRKTDEVTVKDAWLSENKLIDDAVKDGKGDSGTLKTIIEKLREVKHEEDTKSGKDTDEPSTTKTETQKDTDRLNRVEKAVERVEKEVPKTEIETTKKELPVVKDEPKDTTTTRTIPVTTVKETTPPSNKETSPGTTGGPTTRVITKVDEDTFFSKFNDLFINNFYLDENDTPCTLKVTAGDRVRVVTLYADQSGYSLKSNTLPDFANAIDAYCVRKDPSVKLKLQSRFDTEYPFNE